MVSEEAAETSGLAGLEEPGWLDGSQEAECATHG